VLKEYTIYRITSPSGRMYVGYTSLAVAERWRHHRNRADGGEAPNHPFYCEIRQYGAQAFGVETLETVSGLEEALFLEKKYIAECPGELRLNLSPGGHDDAWFGRQHFWMRMRNNPEERAAYLQKLSDTKKANDWSDYALLSRKAEQWRKEHPREAYKMAYRAQRIARRNQPEPLPKPPETQEERKQRLMWKYRRSEMTRQAALRTWGSRSREERAEIGAKLSAAGIARAAAIDPDQRRHMTEKARAAIDREKQCVAVSEGSKKYWEELRKDPERYRALMERKSVIGREAGQKRAANLSQEERRAMTEKARSAPIDRQKQGTAISGGLKRYWSELRNDPSRQAEYQARREAAARGAKGRKKCEPTT
jgi:hypothetical protein